ncbi:nucleoside triphosphatase NudI [mine drainage metagenome]|uniref:Nucleoside triphosphatase NudI n=1 Tax=mine drainage metagenome TaxID=410659 RepID=A0A1J5SDZ9_9ZZZZ
MPFAPPPLPPPDPAAAAQADAHGVTALLLTEDGRFLLQLRDDIPGIALPGHWACFGGHAEAGENAEQAMRRELDEELGYRPAALTLFHRALYTLPRPVRPIVRNDWFLAPLPLAALPALRQQEGAGMALFSLEQARNLPKISPFDLCVMMLLAQWPRLYP